jgi:hypothetical protein
MHRSTQLEALAAQRIRNRFAEVSRLAHGARADSRAAGMTRGEAGSKKVRLSVPRLSATRRTCDAPSIRIQRRAS